MMLSCSNLISFIRKWNKIYYKNSLLKSKISKINWSMRSKKNTLRINSCTILNNLSLNFYYHLDQTQHSEKLEDSGISCSSGK